MEMAYIQLLPLVNCLVKGLKKIDPSDQNQDLQAVWSLTLSALVTIQHVDLQSLSQAPLYSSLSTDKIINCISSALKYSITPLLTQHNVVISKLASILEQHSASMLLFWYSV